MITENTCQELPMKKLYIVKGDDKDYNLTFYSDEEKTTRLNITGYTVYFTVKKKLTDTDDEAKIQKVVTVHTDAVEGETTVTLDNTETDIPTGEYKYDIQLIDTLDRVITVIRGDFIVEWEVTFENGIDS